ncbi:MAG: flagellin [Thermodesulfobacteriota bacterium]
MPNVDVTRIAGNLTALNSLNSLQNVNSQLATHQTRLTTGKRLLSGADDPAGMTIATSLATRSDATKTSLNAISDGKNMISTSENGLMKMQDILGTMRSKALEAGRSDISAAERESINNQLKGYRDQLNDIVGNTQWNGRNLLSGAKGEGKTEALNISTGPDQEGGTMKFSFQEVKTTTGPNGQSGSGGETTVLNANQGFNASAGTNDGQSISATGLGLNDEALTITTTTTTNEKGETVTTNNATDVFKKIDTALNAVKTGLGQAGSFNAKLTFKEETLLVQQANTEAAYNRIMNANMAEEQLDASKYAILQQTATAMLAQANTAPQYLLQLFR